jgi:hypothetical protein
MLFDSCMWEFGKLVQQSHVKCNADKWQRMKFVNARRTDLDVWVPPIAQDDTKEEMISSDMF